MIPYGRQTIDELDELALLDVLRAPYLTTGPRVDQFERQLASLTGATEAVVVNSGTAALHTAVHVAGIGPGDEVIVPALTFAASANAVLYCGGTVRFADVDPGTLTVSPASVRAQITERTRAIVAVDYAGQPCDYDAIDAIALEHGLTVIADACHSLGASYHGAPVGTLAALSAFSFHPVKPITTAEGGAITTGDPELARRMRVFRNHGITSTASQRDASGAVGYEMVELGFNYRLSDLQCALGAAQLGRLEAWIERRQQIAARYDAAFADDPLFTPLERQPDSTHAYHLYVVRVADGQRDAAFRYLREKGIGATLHYPPVHLHPYYRERFGTGPGLCPIVERAAAEVLSLPVFPSLTDAEVDVVTSVCHDFAVRAA